MINIKMVTIDIMRNDSLFIGALETRGIETAFMEAVVTFIGVEEVSLEEVIDPKLRL